MALKTIAVRVTEDLFNWCVAAYGSVAALEIKLAEELETEAISSGMGEYIRAQYDAAAEAAKPGMEAEAERLRLKYRASPVLFDNLGVKTEPL